MEAIVVETKSKRKTDLLLKLSQEMGLCSKKISIEDIEDFFLAKSIKEGIKSGYTSKEKVLKALRK
jgi:predicted DNA-binding protein